MQNFNTGHIEYTCCIDFLNRVNADHCKTFRFGHPSMREFLSDLINYKNMFVFVLYAMCN